MTSSSFANGDARQAGLAHILQTSPARSTHDEPTATRVEASRWMSPFLAILVAGIIVFVPVRYFARWLQKKGRAVEKNRDDDRGTQ